MWLDFGLGTGPVTVRSFITQPVSPGAQRIRLFPVPGAISWRLPLGLQLVPGVLLGLGAFTLPNSPRLLVYQGKRDEALASLAKLRLRSIEEAETDPLLQVRYFAVVEDRPTVIYGVFMVE